MPIPGKIRWITIEDGNVFEGTEKQFEECFFVGPTEAEIIDWCDNHHWRVRFKWWTTQQVNQRIREIEKEATPA